MMIPGTARNIDAAHEAAGQLAVARGELYRFLVRQLTAPPGSQQASTAALWDEWNQMLGALDEEHLLALGAYLRSPECTLDRLDREFVELFRLPTGRYLAPVESAYRCAGNGVHKWAPESLRGPSFHSVLAFYAGAGFQPWFDPALEADHLACELAFLGFLCDVEAAAWTGREAVTAMACRARALEFVRKHPLRWIADVRRQFSVVSSDPYYDVALTVADEFLHIEAAQLKGAEVS